MPDDPTPLGDAMTHRFPDQQIPPTRSSDSGSPAADHEMDMSDRPPLPDHAEPMAADVEDEDADPVTDTGPGIADGPRAAPCSGAR